MQRSRGSVFKLVATGFLFSIVFIAFTNCGTGLEELEDCETSENVASEAPSPQQQPSRSPFTLGPASQDSESSTLNWGGGGQGGSRQSAENQKDENSSVGSSGCKLSSLSGELGEIIGYDEQGRPIYRNPANGPGGANGSGSGAVEVDLSRIQRNEKGEFQSSHGIPAGSIMSIDEFAQNCTNGQEKYLREPGASFQSQCHYKVSRVSVRAPARAEIPYVLVKHRCSAGFWQRLNDQPILDSIVQILPNETGGACKCLDVLSKKADMTQEFSTDVFQDLNEGQNLVQDLGLISRRDNTGTQTCFYRQRRSVSCIYPSALVETGPTETILANCVSDNND